MAINQKHVFWEALVISIFIFGIGFIGGMFLENNRSAETLELYLSSESNLLDMQMFSDLTKNSNGSCDLLINKNIEFGNMIYRDATRIEKYEEAQKITPEIIGQHRRYDLLRTLFWMNSIKIKENCGGISTVVYFYEYEPSDISLRAKQKVFSRYLSDLKEEFGGDIVLIPLAINMDLSSLEIMMENYNINSTGILVDETIFIEQDVELSEAREYLSKLYHNNP